MPINFDPNSLNNVFDKNFGAGAYNSGVSSAAKSAALKQQASFAKTDYLKRLQKAQQEALKPKKSYFDAVDYWNDPSNKNSLKQQGAYRVAEDIKNDPSKQAELKAQGYNVSDYIDAMYNAASDGKYRSQREYNGFSKQLNKDNAPNRKANQDSIQMIIDMNKLKKEQKQADKKKQQQKVSNASKMNWYDNLNAGGQRIGDQFLKTVFGDNFSNWNNQQDKKLAQYELKQNPNDINAIKALNRDNTAYSKANTIGQKTLNYVGGTAGNLLPYLVGDGILGAGEKVLAGSTKGTAQKVLTSAINPSNLVTNIIGKKALQGATSGIVGGGLQMGGHIIGSGEKYTPQQVSTNLAEMGIAGAVLNPALYGLGKGIAKLLGKNVPETLGLPAPHEQLGLPAPTEQPRLTGSPSTLGLPAPQRQLQSPDSPLMSMAKQTNSKIRTLPDMSFGKPVTDNTITNVYGVTEQFDPMKHGKPEYWQKRYNDFVKFVHDKGYNENNLNYDAINELWTHFANPNEPNLNAVIDLAYKGYQAPKQPLNSSNVWDKMGNRPVVSKKANNIMGIPDLNAAPSVSNQAPKPLEPLIFKRTIQNETIPLNSQKKSLAIDPKSKGYENISSSAKTNDITAPNPEDGHGYGLTDLKSEANNVISKDLENEIKKIKDIASPQVGTKNIYELADRLPKQLGDHLKKSLDTAKKNYVNHLEILTNELHDTVVKKLGIKSGSKESKLVQDFGEKKISLDELKRQSPHNWKNIVKADQYFRQKYDQLIEQVNHVRKQIYPNNPEKIVPKRKDYYHHFNELDGFEGVKNLFETPANIDPHLEGVSLYTKPKTKWQGFMQRRGLGPYKSDAVGGFVKYIKAASHSINIDPIIPVLRRTAKTLADATTESKNANKIIQSLEMNAGDIAGKTNPYDRLLQLSIGRKGERILNWVNSRVKGNMVLGNLSSALGQLGNIPLSIGKAKTHSVPGLLDTIGQTTREIFHGDKTAPIYQSNFLKERYTDSLFRRFDQKLIQQPRRLAVWMLETADKSGTRFTWNSMYQKGLKEGVSDPIKYADYETRKLVAGRGIGEVPLVQKSKTAQIFMPFTLEVGNQWKVLRKMVGEKDATGIITALVASYGLNKAIEQLRGSGVSFDPIDAIIEGYQKKDGNITDKLLNASASLTGEVVGNIPGGNMLTQMVDTNKNVPFTDIQYKKLFGERNPNRFGTGLTLGKVANDPAYLLPFGASQIRKTTKGIDTAINGGVYKNRNNFIPFTGDKVQLQYPVKNDVINNLQLALMGTSSVPQARDYYYNNRQPLSEKQTNMYNQMGTNEQKQSYYDNLMNIRKSQTIKEKINNMQKDKNLSPQKKQEELLRLMKELSNIQK